MTDDEEVSLRARVHEMEREVEAAHDRMTEAEAMARGLRVKLKAQHAELMRRHRRDLELAQHLPAIAARLAVLAADAKDPPAEPVPLEEMVDDVGAG